MKHLSLPSTCTSNYWIYADYSRYIFKKPLVEREVGKWLIFENINAIDTTWAIVKKATEEGLLGPYSKVSTQKRSSDKFDKNSFVICVYTEDYNDKNDLKRVEAILREIGIKKEIYYKLNKDAGKYEHDGHTDLIKEISKSQ